jgi:hypothetical protein
MRTSRDLVSCEFVRRKEGFDLSVPVIPFLKDGAKC